MQIIVVWQKKDFNVLDLLKPRILGMILVLQETPCMSQKFTNQSSQLNTRTKSLSSVHQLHHQFTPSSAYTSNRILVSLL